jgi:hypothetical protein
MQIFFESRHSHSAQLKEESLQRVRFVLRRVSSFVPHARVQLSDINGPRGGLDKRCQVELKTDNAGTVVISSIASNWRTALERSLRRAVRTLTRSLQRAKRPVRNRLVKLSLDS